MMTLRGVLSRRILRIYKGNDRCTPPFDRCTPLFNTCTPLSNLRPSIKTRDIALQA